MDKIVKFEHWCESCKHHKEYEGDDPCNDCLTEPATADRKPSMYDGPKGKGVKHD